MQGIWFVDLDSVCAFIVEQERQKELWRARLAELRREEQRATVKFFNTAKGFGFIESDEGGKDVFVHATALEAAGIRMLKEGDRVSFVLEDDRRGRGKQAGQLKQI